MNTKFKTITSKSNKTFIFRLPQPEDLDALYQYAITIEKEDTFILLNPNEPVSLEEEQLYLQKTLTDIKTKTKIHLFVIKEDKIIGSSHIAKQGRRQNHVGQLGIVILAPYRSDGIGKQLANYMIELAQKELQINQVILDCFANNLIAINFYKSLGFTQYGCQPKAVTHKNQLIDKLLFYKNLT